MFFWKLSPNFDTDDELCFSHQWIKNKNFLAVFVRIQKTIIQLLCSCFGKVFISPFSENWESMKQISNFKMVAQFMWYLQNIIVVRSLPHQVLWCPWLTYNFHFFGGMFSWKIFVFLWCAIPYMWHNEHCAAPFNLYPPPTHTESWAPCLMSHYYPLRQSLTPMSHVSLVPYVSLSCLISMSHFHVSLLYKSHFSLSCLTIIQVSLLTFMSHYYMFHFYVKFDVVKHDLKLKVKNQSDLTHQRDT